MAKDPPTYLASVLISMGMSQQQLADLACTAKQQINKFHSGERPIPTEWARRLAPHLGMKWHELIDRQEGVSLDGSIKITAQKEAPGPKPSSDSPEKDEYFVLLREIWGDLFEDEKKGLLTGINAMIEPRRRRR